MNAAEIDQHLHATFADQRLSRGERKALQALVENPPELKARLRRRAFALAEELATTAPLPTVLEWLEDIVKALADQPPAATTSHEPYFSPREDIPSRIIHTLGATRERAELCVFTITDDRVTAAILDAHKRGIAVRIVTDNDKSGDLGSDIRTLVRAGIPVRVDQTGAHMHHKFAVIDGRVVINGSYNWTRSAARENHENIVISRDPDLAQAFTREFDHCWDLAVPF